MVSSDGLIVTNGCFAAGSWVSKLIFVYKIVFPTIVTQIYVERFTVVKLVFHALVNSI